MDFIGVLIGDQPAMESNISYYQRLLAMDQAEAAEIVEDHHLKTHPQEQLFDGVQIPALNYAREGPGTWQADGRWRTICFPSDKGDTRGPEQFEAPEFVGSI